MLGSVPLMAVIIIIYNVLVYVTGVELSSVVMSFTLISGEEWPVHTSDLLLLGGLILLFFEIVRATSSSTSSIINHGLSMLVFVAALIEFIVLAPFGNTTFFLLTCFALFDVLAGFIITIVTARRDFAVGD